MILGDYNVSLNFARDTYNYLTDPHHNARKKINQWLYNAEFTEVYKDTLNKLDFSIFMAPVINGSHLHVKMSWDVCVWKIFRKV